MHVYLNLKIYKKKHSVPAASTCKYNRMMTGWMYACVCAHAFLKDICM